MAPCESQIMGDYTARFFLVPFLYFNFMVESLRAKLQQAVDKAVSGWRSLSPALGSQELFYPELDVKNFLPGQVPSQLVIGGFQAFINQFIINFPITAAPLVQFAIFLGV